MAKKEPKKYRIESIQDIINAVTDKNLDNFLIDFRAYLKFANGLKQKGIVQTGAYIWIDDGKHNADIKVHEVRIEL